MGTYSDRWKPLHLRKIRSHVSCALPCNKKTTMKYIKIIIERTKDMFSAYAENIPGIYGGGDTVEEAKSSINNAIRLLKKHNKKKHIPAILNEEFAIVYKYDAES